MTGDTIFALASGAGRAAIAVVRISGPRAGAVVQAMARRVPAPRLATVRRLRDPRTSEVLDEALVLWFPGPASYTGEDSAEFHLHGGRAVVAAVADALVSVGARPAEPGEFTRRAFLHGRLDLTAAEGIADLIDAETEAQRRQALRQSGGALGHLYASWTARLTRILARQEAFIEFEEEDLPEDLDARVGVEAAMLRDEIGAHLAASDRSERLREGLVFAILGAPNVGKSSLLNALAGRNAAIVSARAGTTRDLVEVVLDLGGVPVVLADTAGLRESADEIEAEGIRRALRRAEEASLLITVFAANQEPDDATLRILQRPDSSCLVVVNKCDLAAPPARLGGQEILAVAAQTGEGLEVLRSRLADLAADRAGLTAAVGLTRPRHRAALEEAVHWLDDLSAAPLPEMRAEALRAALAAIGRITGRVGVEAILDLVFGEFCIGK